MFVKKIAKFLLAFITLLVLVPANLTYAGFQPSCTEGVSITKVAFEDTYLSNSGQELSIQASGLSSGNQYRISAVIIGGLGGTAKFTYPITPNADGNHTFVMPVPESDNQYRIVLDKTNALPAQQICTIGTITVTNDGTINCEYRVTQQRTHNNQTKTCNILSDSGTCVDRKSPLNVEVKVTDRNGQPVNRRVDVQVKTGLGWEGQVLENGQGTFTFQPDQLPGDNGTFEIKASQDTWWLNYQYCNGVSATMKNDCTDPATNAPICSGGEDWTTPTPGDDDDAGDANPYRLCAQIPNPAMQAKCEDCAGGEFGREGVWTAIGCIKRDPKSIIQSLMQIGLGMGGGVALISVLAGGFILSTSQGDPSKANQAKEIITNSVIGILFIIFSVVILQFIGVTIFNIPGFGTVK